MNQVNPEDSPGRRPGIYPPKCIVRALRLVPWAQRLGESSGMEGDNIMTKAGRLLAELGVSDTKIGFRILEQLIGLVVDDPSLARNLFGEATVIATERCGASYESSAKSIRYALHEAVVRSDFEKRLERTEQKYGIPDIRDIMTGGGAISAKKLVLKAANALGDSWKEEAR